jgi:hypothetical protein
MVSPEIRVHSRRAGRHSDNPKVKRGLTAEDARPFHTIPEGPRAVEQIE